jgi:hypothetical protein
MSSKRVYLVSSLSRHFINGVVWLRAAGQGLKPNVFEGLNVAAEAATHKDCLAEAATYMDYL